LLTPNHFTSREARIIPNLDTVQRKDEDNVHVSTRPDFKPSRAMPGAHNEERNLPVARAGKLRLLFVASLDDIPAQVTLPIARGKIEKVSQ
jgi:hypothetical protein